MRGTIIAFSVPLLCALASCAPVAQDLDPATQSMQAIEAMGYQNINFSVSKPQFLKEFRGALKVANADEGLGVTYYAIQGVEDPTDVIGFQFLNDELMNLLISYRDDRIDQLGGTEALKIDAIKQFGSPTEENDAGTVWSFPKIDRKIVAVLHEGIWTLSLQRMSLAEQLQTRKTQLTGMQSDEPQPSRASDTDEPKEGWVFWQPTAADRAEMEAEIAKATGQSSSISRTAIEPFGLSESERKRIFRQIADVEDRASRVAMALVPDSMILRQIEVQDELEKKYKDELARQYQLTQSQLLEIAVEGVTKGWAY